MSLPIMISMLVQALVQRSGQYLCRTVQRNAFAAVSLAFPVQMLIIAVAVGTGVGMNSLVSRRLGEKKFTDANAGVSTGIFLGIFSWTAFAVFGLFFSRMFFEAFTAGDDDGAEIAEMGTQYISICTIFLVRCFHTDHMRTHHAVHGRHDLQYDHPDYRRGNQYHSRPDPDFRSRPVSGNGRCGRCRRDGRRANRAMCCACISPTPRSRK